VPAHVISGIEEYKEKSMAKWTDIGISGDRSTWQKQLVKHFWQQPATAKMEDA
jgi:hypothetical protein